MGKSIVKSHLSSKRTPKNTLQITPLFWISAVFILFFLFLYEPRKDSVEDQQQAQDLVWNEMAQSLEETMATYRGEVGLYAKDLKTGRIYEYNADYLFASASLIKVPIMAATFQAAKEGKIDLGTRLKFNRRFRREGAGRIRYARSGTPFSVSHLLYAMMTYSDNTATAMLVDKLGYEYLNDSFRKFGLETTRIQSTGLSLSNRINPEEENYTTPREMGRLLEKIYRNELASADSSALMLEIMKGVPYRNRLARHLPRHWKLAHKTGLLRKNCHDVGIVFTPEGDYVLCVLTSQNSNYRMAKSFISNLGRKAYARMGNS